MGLFSTLTSTESAASTLSIPTIVQLYSNGNPISLEKKKHPGYSLLSYQSVQASPPTASEETSGGGGLLLNADATDQGRPSHPNLGVWDIHVTAGGSHEQKPLIDQLLKVIPAASTFCFTVDLSNLSAVEPSISVLQDSLVRFLIESSTSESPSDSAAATTTLFDLQSTNFGLAPKDEESAKKMSSSAPKEEHQKVKIALMICALLPSQKGSEDGGAAAEGTGEYKQKQAEALVLYHLRRYAASLNASLVFVREDSAPTSPEEEKSHQHVAAMTVDQLAYTWHQLAKGVEVWKTDESESLTVAIKEGEEKEDVEVDDTLIHGPGRHQEELIESVLLRNAQYPGQWDASKDSLWVALPASDSPLEGDKSTEGSQKEKGDEGWLSQLRDSVASEIKTPPPSATKAEAKDAKTPNDAAVSSFFESLLKP